MRDHHGHQHQDHHGHHHHDHTVPHNHNAPGAVQWQTPHRPDDKRAATPPDQTDLDLVEAAFVDSFPTATDPISFLRLSGVAFEGTTPSGEKLVLLRVEIQDVTDVGALMPHLGGGGFRYDPLPAKMASHRKRLAFLYFDGAGIQSLSLTAARALSPVSHEQSKPL